MICHYITDVSNTGEKIKILIPGCWGSIIYGKHRCTCHSHKRKRSYIQKLESKVSELEAKVVQLEYKLKLKEHE